MSRASVHKESGWANVVARVSSATVTLAEESHRLYRALNPDSRVDDLYREMLANVRNELTAQAIAAGIDPTTIPPHPRSKAARLLREANAAANDPARKAMPKGQIRPKRSPIRE